MELSEGREQLFLHAVQQSGGASSDRAGSGRAWPGALKVIELIAVCVGVYVAVRTLKVTEGQLQQNQQQLSQNAEQLRQAEEQNRLTRQQFYEVHKSNLLSILYEAQESCGGQYQENHAKGGREYGVAGESPQCLPKAALGSRENALLSLIQLERVYHPLPMSPSAVEPYRISLSRIDLRGANLPAVDLSFSDLSHANLSGANLSGANLDGALLVGTVLTDANLDSARFHGTRFEGVSMEGVRLEDAVFRKATFSKSNLEGAWMMYTSFVDSEVWETSFRRVRMVESGMQRGRLFDVDFSEALIEHSGFSQVGLAHVDFSGADIRTMYYEGSISSAVCDQPTVSIKGACGNDLTQVREGYSVERCSLRYLNGNGQQSCASWGRQRRD